MADTFAAADAFFPGNFRGRIGMLTQLALPGSAAHAQVLEGSPKTGQFMALEVGYTDNGIGIDNVGRNKNRLKIFLTDWNLNGRSTQCASRMLCVTL